MNAWSSHEDAWWWALWTPGSMSGEHPPVRDSLLAAGDGTVSKHTENFPAVAAAQLLDSQASVHDYDAHSGWGTHEGTLCPLIHCPEEMMGELMQLASIQSSTDCVLDIGCGDGRVVLAAARAGARGIGIDINPSLIRAAKARAKSDGLEHAVKFEECDLKHLHIGHPLLEGVSVVYLYLLPEVLEILLGLIRELLQRGVRVVTLDHHLPPPPKGFAVSGEALFGALRLYGAS